MKLKVLNETLQLENLDNSLNNIEKDLKDGNLLCVSSLGNERMHIISALDKQIIYVAKDSYQAQEAYSTIKGYLFDEVAIYQPNDDVLLYRKSFQKSLSGERTKALYAFLTKKVKVLVTSAIGLTQFVANKERLLESVINIKVGKKLSMYDLITRLSTLGYSREVECEEKNTFSVHGDVVDVFLAAYEMPIKISFFDDEVEFIKFYDAGTKLSIQSLNEVTLYPNNDILATQEEIEGAIKRAANDAQKLTIKGAERATQIIDDLALSLNCSQKMQWLLPFFNMKKDTIFDYVEDGIMVLEDIAAIANIIKNYRLEHETRLKDFIKSGEALHAHKIVILDDEDITSKFKNIRTLGFSNTLVTSKYVDFAKINKIESKKLANFSKFDALKEVLMRSIKCEEIVYICQTTKDQAKALANSISDIEVPAKYVEEAQDKFGVYIIAESIEQGFSYPKSRLTVIGSKDIHKKESIGVSKSSKRVFVMPQIGDYVVHDYHGIGRCLALKRMQHLGVEKDYVVVEYRNGGMLYLPTDQIDRLSRYSGAEVAPKLSSLGGADFAKTKEKVKKSLKALAFDLVSLYSQRQQMQGYRYDEDDWMMKDFENSFEFEPTEDQKVAIMDIKQDMEKGVVMDRLLCGDVGYGKTEVALRAIFKTVIAGKQAAILAPTTILAQQHFRTAQERMKDFGVEIELLSRMKSKKEINESLERIKSGKTQLVIATHRLLSKDVQFADLGLLVLDEEQRFGVGHKEKLKILKKNLNVLTLSATPIPRTLNMSLIGVRDISVLDTPPQNRLAVQTAVTELTNTLLEDSIKREIARGGQVFILHNEVASIERFTNIISDLVPEANVIFAHGKMDKRMLEDRMEKFYSKEANVLVCTTIIENGIDIPDANTLIVCNADKLGLSQLYQLRGRVGRSNRLAYAYFTVEAGKVLTQDAYKRLNAIMDYTELGSGFKIAMRDLEIRGAGNILGSAQHGHIVEVGYDMYCKLLEECIGEIRGNVKVNRTCKIDADISAYLDREFVSDDNARIRILREIVDVTTPEEQRVLCDKIVDSFGSLPQVLENLITIGLVRNLAQELGVEMIRIKNQGMGIMFYSIEAFKNEKLMQTINEYKDTACLANAEKPALVFKTAKLGNVEKLNILKEFLLKATF